MKKEVQLRAYAALKQVGLEDDYFYQSPTFDLSAAAEEESGHCRVLAMKPEVLILDENQPQGWTRRGGMKFWIRLHL